MSISRAKGLIDTQGN